MEAEAVFVAAYSVALLVLSAGLHRLGRVNTDPWRSRVLAGHRRVAGDHPPAERGPDWPHTEVPRLHTGMALVAAGAATMLTAAEVFRHHRLAEAMMLGAVVALALGVCFRLLRQLHPPQRGEP